MTKYYIAYGSNLNTQQMKFRCPTARVVGVSLITGYQLLFKGSHTGSYLTIEPQTDSRVPVGVWEVTEADELALDRYEGYPSFYYKTEMEIPLLGINETKIKTVKAFVYIMHEERKLGIPSKAYVETCTVGYKEFGFNESYLRDALDISLESRKIA